MKLAKNRKPLTTHFTKYHTIYIFTVILFITGIIFGAIIVNSMTFVQKQDLFFYLERFFLSFLQEDPIAKQSLFKNSFLYHMQFLSLLFFLGLAVIGLPIIWILLFIKGVAIGFTVGFFVNQLGLLEGLLFSFSAIAPQNLIIIPIYIIASSFAMIFSLTLLQSMFSKRYKQPILQLFSRYIGLFISLVIVISLAALLESFISFEAMKMISDRIIK
ncbi:stage II sporulation protein M [Gracilibacillus boraciitolerans JCM 21714]|uniref:Stage II sporulation protein M n=1 Tax=Gracilibacillus boraciitolerans JCM 21714 TaxID=1298598 RepID=W4VD08_9BACI|nr:stage II sporulation protein M [Gracilibacillus boraciitolerans]GAE91295.1 stage II sporulation protein M [Gracilibacillus boraciitolerans JCM 21714]